MRKNKEYDTPEQIAKRKKRWWLIGTISFALIGGAAFIVGYGLKDGWASVLAWFSSKWATYVYIGIVVYVTVVFIGYKQFSIDKMTK